MINTFYAYKKEMTGKYTARGNRVGATVLVVPKQTVLDSKTTEKNGYNALRLQILNSKSKILNNDKKPKFKIKEVRTDEIIEPKSEVKFEEMVKPGDRVTITAVSKGKGFAGVVKKYHFRGGPRTHGQSDRERAPGSSGSTTTPGRVYKGKRRAGHMGTDTVTMKNIEVIEVNGEKREITVSGSIPGAKKFSLVRIKV